MEIRHQISGAREQHVTFIFIPVWGGGHNDYADKNWPQNEETTYREKEMSENAAPVLQRFDT